MKFNLLIKNEGESSFSAKFESFNVPELTTREQVQIWAREYVAKLNSEKPADLPSKKLVSIDKIHSSELS